VHVLTGAHIGTVIAMPLSGVLAEHLGWPSVFYVFGKFVIIFLLPPDTLFVLLTSEAK